MSVDNYINELKNQRDLLADILTEKGVESSRSEKFNTLIPKVNDISTGGGGGYEIENAVITPPLQPAINGSIESMHMGELESTILPYVTYVSDTDDANAKTSTTLTINVNDNDSLLIACAMIRCTTSNYDSSDFSISGDGWTAIFQDDSTTDDSERQYNCLWYKKVNKGAHTVTISHSENQRMSAKLFSFDKIETATNQIKKFSGVSLVDKFGNSHGDSSDSFTPVVTPGKVKMFLISNFWEESTLSISNAMLDAYIQLRFKVYIDLTGNSTPTFTVSQSSFNIAVFELITE